MIWVCLGNGTYAVLSGADCFVAFVSLLWKIILCSISSLLLAFGSVGLFPSLVSCSLNIEPAVYIHLAAAASHRLELAPVSFRT